MRIPLSALLIVLLVWDFATAKPGQSAIERSGHAIAQSQVFKSFMASIEAKSGESRNTGSTAAALTDTKSARSVSRGASLTDAQTQAWVETQAGREDQANLSPNIASREIEAIKHSIASQQWTKGLASQDTTSTASAALHPAVDTAATDPRLAKGAGSALASEDADQSLRHSELVDATIVAGRRANVSDGYLVHLALVEGGLRETANAATSSASGPFQFIDQTWLSVVSKYGAMCGLADLAHKIESRHGVYYVKNAEVRRHILALRKDPYLSSFLAAQLTKENALFLRQALKREPLEGDLYVAHILGPNDAVRLIMTTSTDPTRSAASMFPTAARANYAVFYQPDGRPRSVSELYEYLTRYPSPKLLDLYRKRAYADKVAENIQ